MIIKIISDFNNFDEIMDSLKKYNCFFRKGFLYISDVKNTNKSKFKKFINSLVNKNSYIVEITKDNLSQEDLQTQNWCKSQITWAEVIEYEKQEQKELQQKMELLNTLEEIIFEERSNDNGGANDNR